MTAEQKNNPLHGLKTDCMVKELVEHYGWEILFTAMRFRCFKKNPSIKGAIKFLRSTDWAKEKLENFYLLRFKRMPRPSDEEFNMPARARSFSAHIVPRKPMKLTIESIELSQAKSAVAHQKSSNKQRENNASRLRQNSPHKDTKRASNRSRRQNPFKAANLAKDKRSPGNNKKSESIPYDPSNPWNQ